ncbi:TetR/AcrR family transcriptional regulator [Enterococcus sp. AZ072]|uniref:TetR/AcrR family transcriptional regulator n=1 Tax=unclassified Enterococcus TaxID=2608891 RepID=UPI003D29D4B1
MAKKYDSQGTINEILSHAANLFLEKGFSNTSMNDIATAAGISKGAIYHHFKSKEEIVEAVTTQQEVTIREIMERWLLEAETLNGKEKLQFILEKNIDSQEVHCLDDVMSARMKSAEFVLRYMKDSVHNGAPFIAEIIKKGIEDGSLTTDFPDEIAETFLLLLNVWCDPAVFNGTIEKLDARLKFLQTMMIKMGVDVLSDVLIKKTVNLLQKLYFEGEQRNE